MEVLKLCKPSAVPQEKAFEETRETIEQQQQSTDNRRSTRQRVTPTKFKNFVVTLPGKVNENSSILYEKPVLVFCFVYHSGEEGRRIRELTSLVKKRFKFSENSVELYVEKVNNRWLCAIAQAKALRYKLLGGLAVRSVQELPCAFRACYGVVRFVMENGAKGCEVIVSVKLRAQRAMKFEDGYMISSGQPVNEYIDSAVRHVLLRQCRRLLHSEFSSTSFTCDRRPATRQTLLLAGSHSINCRRRELTTSVAAVTAQPIPSAAAAVVAQFAPSAAAQFCLFLQSGQCQQNLEHDQFHNTDGLRGSSCFSLLKDI
ncbi:hypothetical protein BVRB_2g034020 isoform A [Beta vulgaris subsp. vulgaris]|nr:hypothetical protein BVRB_2g034020 isoform A [Beta vulgaris subsp. vulgaris]